MLACGQNSSNVAEEVIENLLFGEMSISEALKFDIRYFGIARLVCDVLFELFEFLLAAKEVSCANVQLCDLCGIEDESHLI